MLGVRSRHGRQIDACMGRAGFQPSLASKSLTASTSFPQTWLRSSSTFVRMLALSMFPGHSLLRALRRGVALPLWFAAVGHGAEYFVAPDASRDGDGSAAKPWSLSVALGHPAGLRPGDTVWVRYGLYAGGFTSTLKGAADAPITVRAGGKRATID